MVSHGKLLKRLRQICAAHTERTIRPVFAHSETRNSQDLWRGIDVTDHPAEIHIATIATNSTGASRGNHIFRSHDTEKPTATPRSKAIRRVEARTGWGNSMTVPSTQKYSNPHKSSVNFVKILASVGRPQVLPSGWACGFRGLRIFSPAHAENYPALQWQTRSASRQRRDRWEMTWLRTAPAVGYESCKAGFLARQLPASQPQFQTIPALNRWLA